MNNSKYIGYNSSSENFKYTDNVIKTPRKGDIITIDGEEYRYTAMNTTPWQKKVNNKIWANIDYVEGEKFTQEKIEHLYFGENSEKDIKDIQINTQTKVKKNLDIQNIFSRELDHQDIINRLLENREGWFLIEYLEELVQLDEHNHNKIISHLIQTSEFETLIRHINKFTGGNNQKIIEEIIKNGGASVVGDYLDKISDIDDGKIALTMIYNKKSIVVIRHLDKFKNLDMSIAKALKEAGWSKEVQENIFLFKHNHKENKEQNQKTRLGKLFSIKDKILEFLVKNKERYQDFRKNPEKKYRYDNLSRRLKYVIDSLKNKLNTTKNQITKKKIQTDIDEPTLQAQEITHKIKNNIHPNENTTNDTEVFQKNKNTYSENTLNITPEEYSNIKDNIREGGQKFLGQEDYKPKYKYQIEEQTFFLTNKIIDQGREFVMGYIKVNNTYEPRFFYFSQSGGNWHCCPGIESHSGYPNNTSSNKGRYSKGEFANLSYEKGTIVDSRLGDIFQKLPQDVLSDTLLNGDFVEAFGNINESKEDIQAFENENKAEIWGPKEIFADLQSINDLEEYYHKFYLYFLIKNDFKPLPKYSQEHKYLGKITVEPFEVDINGDKIKIEYAYISSEPELVWIENIIFLQAKLNSYGLRDRSINAGVLTTKPLEYRSQIPKDIPHDKIYGNARQYLDIREYLQENPLIKHYKQLKKNKGAMEVHDETTDTSKENTKNKNEKTINNFKNLYNEILKNITYLEEINVYETLEFKYIKDIIAHKKEKQKNIGNTRIVQFYINNMDILKILVGNSIKILLPDQYDTTKIQEYKNGLSQLLKSYYNFVEFNIHIGEEYGGTQEERKNLLDNFNKKRKEINNILK